MHARAGGFQKKQNCNPRRPAGQMAAKLVHLGGLPANSSIDGTYQYQYQGFITVNNLLRLTPQMQMMAMAAATLANGSPDHFRSPSPLV